MPYQGSTTQLTITRSTNLCPPRMLYWAMNATRHALDNAIVPCNLSEPYCNANAPKMVLYYQNCNAVYGQSIKK